MTEQKKEWRRTKLYRDAREVVVALQKGPATIAELAELLGFSWVRVYRCLCGMRAAGWPVEKARREEDRVRVEWTLTGDPFADTTEGK